MKTHLTMSPLTALKRGPVTRDRRLIGVHVVSTLALCSLLVSCSLLGHQRAPDLQTYTLSDALLPDQTADVVNAPVVVKVLTAAPLEHHRVLLLDTPRAAVGYNSTRMVYVRQPHTQEVFARSVWVDTPARMLAPLMLTHLQQSGLFHAVLQAPSGAQAGLRLDTTFVRLEQDFLHVPSRVHVEWQLILVDNHTRSVLAWHRIHAVRMAHSEDAAGGAGAANAATKEALRQTLDFLQTALTAASPDAKD